MSNNYNDTTLLQSRSQSQFGNGISSENYHNENIENINDFDTSSINKEDSNFNNFIELESEKKTEQKEQKEDSSIQLESEKKTEQKEQEEDNFISNYKKLESKLISRVNFLLNQKAQITFPKLTNENDFNSHLKFLEDINELYYKFNGEQEDLKIKASKSSDKKYENLKSCNIKLYQAIKEICKEYKEFYYDFISFDFLLDFEEEAYKGNNKKNIKNYKKKLEIDFNFIKEQIKPLCIKLFYLKNFFINEWDISYKKLDSRGDFIIPNKNNNIKRGAKIYYPPYGWIGIGLNVSGKYLNNKSDEDGEWLFKTKDSDWANAYIGFFQNSDTNQIKKELIDLIKEKNEKNNKKITLYNKIEDVENQSGIIDVIDINKNKIKYKILLMARVKIKEIIESKNNNNNWIADKQFVRIYRIIFKDITEK